MTSVHARSIRVWFDLDAINPAPSRFNAEKLKWLNQEHMKMLAQDELGRRLVPYLLRASLDPTAGPAPGVVGVLVRDRVATLAEMADAAHYFYAVPRASAERLAEHVNPANRPALEVLCAEFAALPWTREALGAAMKAAAARHGIKPGQVMMALRVLVCGTRETPAIDAVLAVLGRNAVRARLGDCLRSSRPVE
jgi:glutamyl-tRNA synthetase